MNSIVLKSYAKINLSLDVLGLLPNGYHLVEMIMQQVELHDLVTIEWDETNEKSNIELAVNKTTLPLDNNNIAYRAAEIMRERFKKKGVIRINIEKNIPIAAGLAGGSGNGAAVIHGLNYLWGTKLDVKELCNIGVKLGADVPFCIMGQAKSNKILNLYEDILASTCALAQGIGDELTPVEPLEATILLSKPSIGISTAEVYKGIDKEMGFSLPAENESIRIEHHINTKSIINGLNEKKYNKILCEMTNLLEIFSIKRYPIIMYTKDMIQNASRAQKVLMSGSGPTVFCIYSARNLAELDFEVLRRVNEETYITNTSL
ncbi:MAG: 4-(cytidine 5'-diphospho)-2-C-methyl-D-erythritol kinase [Aminipila sp.]